MRRAGFFQTLRGKLIFTYTMVTVLALLSLEVMLLLLGAVLSRVTNRDTLGYLSDVVSILPAQARPYLQPGAHDLPGLQRWLQATYDAGYASRPAQGIFDHPAAPLVKSEPMYVLSPEGSVLAAAPASAQGLIGRRYSPPANVPRSQDILDSAQQMDLQSGHISAVKPDGNYLMAVPVRQGQSEGPLAALIILTVQPPPSLASQWWQQFLSIVPGTAIFLLLAVAPFATLFGFVMSRGLNRRLKGLTQAVDAWSEGDFSVQPQDRARDEISYLGMRMRRMAERVQALLHTQQELTLLEERNRLARELHDTVKQETFATLMQVRAAKNQLERDPAAARAHLDAAEELIKTAQQELGLVISELRPAALEGQGLAGALNDYLSAWSQRSRIPADLQVRHERRLPLQVEQALLRVAQEALSNVARHSRASAVNVQLTFEPERVSLCIADNGIGFDPSSVGLAGVPSTGSGQGPSASSGQSPLTGSGQGPSASSGQGPSASSGQGPSASSGQGPSASSGQGPSASSGQGFGLQSMHERMAAIGGSLSVQTAPGSGTTVTAGAPAIPAEEP